MTSTTEPIHAVARLRAGMEAGDPDAAVQALADDVVINSPITLGFAFKGRSQARDLFADVVATISDLRYTDEVGDGDTRVLLAQGRVGTQELREAIVLRLGDDGLISELTLYVRPLPGLTTLAAALGPKVAGRRGRGRALAVAAMLKPLAFVTRRGEGIGARLARP